MQEPVLIMGSGAMACLFAAYLAASEHPVTLISEWEEGITALNRFGVRLIREGDLTSAFRVQALIQPDSRLHSTVLVLVKSWQTRQTAQLLSTCLTSDANILTLQNGLGNLEVLSAGLVSRRVFCGSTTIGATLVAPGIVKEGGTGDIHLPDHPVGRHFAALLSSSGFSVKIQPDIQSIIWGKLVVNAAINPLTALLDVPNGFLLENKHALQLVHSLVNESCQVANAGKITLPYSNSQKYVDQVIQKTAQNFSSMRQDLKRGAPTEIDAINNQIVLYSKKWGVEAPLNQMMVHLVKARLGYGQS